MLSWCAVVTIGVLHADRQYEVLGFAEPFKAVARNCAGGPHRSLSEGRTIAPLDNLFGGRRRLYALN